MAKRVKQLISNVEIVENSVSGDIKVNAASMLVEPVNTLDELLEWEDRLSSLKLDYAIAELNYESDLKRKYSIFTDMVKYEGLTKGNGESTSHVELVGMSELDLMDLEVISDLWSK